MASCESTVGIRDSRSGSENLGIGRSVFAMTLQARSCAACNEAPIPSPDPDVLHAPDVSAPDELVHLQLQTHRQAVLENPGSELLRLEHAVHRREQHRGGPRDQVVALRPRRARTRSRPDP